MRTQASHSHPNAHLGWDISFHLYQDSNLQWPFLAKIRSPHPNDKCTCSRTQCKVWQHMMLLWLSSALAVSPCSLVLLSWSLVGQTHHEANELQPSPGMISDRKWNHTLHSHFYHTFHTQASQWASTITRHDLWQEMKPHTPFTLLPHLSHTIKPMSFNHHQAWSLIVNKKQHNLCTQELSSITIQFDNHKNLSWQWELHHQQEITLVLKGCKELLTYSSEVFDDNNHSKIMPWASHINRQHLL